MKFHLCHAIDGASQTKSSGFSREKKRFEQKLEVMKSLQSQRIFRIRMKKSHSIWLSPCFHHSISIVLLTKLPSYDLNAIWCARLPSRDAKSIVNMATFFKT